MTLPHKSYLHLPTSYNFISPQFLHLSPHKLHLYLPTIHTFISPQVIPSSPHKSYLAIFRVLISWMFLRFFAFVSFRCAADICRVADTVPFSCWARFLRHVFFGSFSFLKFLCLHREEADNVSKWGIIIRYIQNSHLKMLKDSQSETYFTSIAMPYTPITTETRCLDMCHNHSNLHSSWFNAWVWQ